MNSNNIPQQKEDPDMPNKLSKMTTYCWTTYSSLRSLGFNKLFAFLLVIRLVECAWRSAFGEGYFVIQHNHGEAEGEFDEEDEAG